MTATPDTYNWSASPLGHIHARREDGEVVLIVTGGNAIGIAGKLGGLRMPAGAAVSLGRFLLECEA